MTARKATLPSPRDKLTASLADKAYVWGAQAAAASGKLATERPEGLSPEETLWVARMASAALHLNQGAAICAGRAMGNSVMVHRHLWLSLTAMREADKSALLNAPVSSEGLFGPAVASASQRFSRLEEERKHLLGHMPLQKRPNTASFPSVPTGASQNRRKRACRPVARAATATQAAPTAAPVPTSSVPPERSGYNRPPNPSWRGGGRKRRA